MSSETDPSGKVAGGVGDITDLEENGHVGRRDLNKKIGVVWINVQSALEFLMSDESELAATDYVQRFTHIRRIN